MRSKYIYFRVNLRRHRALRANIFRIKRATDKGKYRLNHKGSHKSSRISWTLSYKQLRLHKTFWPIVTNCQCTHGDHRMRVNQTLNHMFESGRTWKCMSRIWRIPSAKIWSPKTAYFGWFTTTFRFKREYLRKEVCHKQAGNVHQLQRVPRINLVNYDPQAANTNNCMHGAWRAGAAIWLAATAIVLLRMCYSHWSLLSLSVWYRSFV